MNTAPPAAGAPRSSLGPGFGKLALEAAGVDLGEDYEALIDRLADRLIRPGGVVVDGGANTGRHTIALARRVAPDGVVHAFEPLAELIEANLGWARSDGVDGVIRYHALGLSDTAGEANFFRNITNPAFSSLRFDVPDTRVEHIHVTVDTLDRLFPNEAVDFIKMDVEGAEFSAFRGGETLLARSRPFIVFENALQWAATSFGYDRDDFFALFARLDLALFDAFGRPFTPANWDDPDVGWYFCAVPPERIGIAEYRDLVTAFWHDRLARPDGATPAAATSDIASDVTPGAASDDAAAVDFNLAPMLPPHLLENARVLATREHILPRLPKGGVFCEVGVAFGDFSARVMELCGVSRFIAIDVFTLHHYPDMWGGRVGRVLGGNTHLGYYMDRFDRELAAGTLQIMAGYSTAMLAELPDDSLDACYIDAHHDFVSVSQELRLAGRKVKPRGVIILDDYIMHDYMSGTPYGVVRAANEFMIEQNWEMIYFALHTGMYCNIAIRRL